MKTPGRVAHVTTAHPSNDNRIFRKECVSLAEAGIDVFLVAVAKEDATIAGVKVLALPSRRGRLARMLLGPVDAWRVLRRLQPALIHVHDPELIPLAALWKLLHSTPAIFDSHEDLTKQVAGKTYIPTALRYAVAAFARLLEVFADLSLDSVVAATPAIAKNFRRVPVTLVQNFPWLRDFPEPAQSEEGGVPALSYVGGITRDRGGMQMISAIQSSSLSPVLTLAGRAAPDMVTAMSADATGRVQYLGILPATQVPNVISASRAGLVILNPLPNYLDSQPTKIFEYMAAGRPFIASDFPTWRALLGEFDCGVFVDPTSANDVRRAIDFIVSRPGPAKAMGVRGRAALVEHFTFEQEKVRLVETTHRLLRNEWVHSHP